MAPEVRVLNDVYLGRHLHEPFREPRLPLPGHQQQEVDLVGRRNNRLMSVLWKKWRGRRVVGEGD